MGKQHIEHCQDLLNLCCQWWQESTPTQTGEFNYYIPFYVKVYKQEITDIVVRNYAKLKKDKAVENIYTNILSCTNIDQKFLDRNFERAAQAEADGEFTLVDNQNFLSLVNILNNVQNQDSGVMKNHERNQYKQVLRDLTREI